MPDEQSKSLLSAVREVSNNDIFYKLGELHTAIDGFKAQIEGMRTSVSKRLDDIEGWQISNDAERNRMKGAGAVIAVCGAFAVSLFVRPILAWLGINI